MNKKVLTLILVIVTATSTNAMAQNIKKWSLRQCIDYAMDNNIQLQKSKISENVAETELKQAKAGLLPNLSGSMTQSLSYRPFQKSSSNFVNGSITSNSSNKTIQNGSYGINANWTVWNGGINTNSIKSKQKNLEITRLESMQQANSIQEQITQLYVQILYSSDAVKVNKEINKKRNNQELTQASIDSVPSGAPREGSEDEGIWREIITENLESDIVREESGCDPGIVDDIVELMVEAVCSTRRYIRVGKEDKPAAAVKSRLLKLERRHLEYVLWCMGKNTTEVRNIRAYLLTSLYNSYFSECSGMAAQVQHDLYGKGGEAI